MAGGRDLESAALGTESYESVLNYPGTDPAPSLWSYYSPVSLGHTQNLGNYNHNVFFVYYLQRISYNVCQAHGVMSKC